MKPLTLVFLVACAGSPPPPGSLDALLKDAETQPPIEACAALTEAMRSGAYSTQRWASEGESRSNREYQLARAREHYCMKAAEPQPSSSQAASQPQ